VTAAMTNTCSDSYRRNSLALDGGWLACSRSGDPFGVRGEEAAADFDKLPSGLTSMSSVESSLRVEDSRIELQGRSGEGRGVSQFCS
jgi:hypothetical protein